MATWSLTLWERNIKLKKSTLPRGLILSGYSAFPMLKIQHALGGTKRFRVESEWMVSAPLFSNGRSLISLELSAGQGIGGTRSRNKHVKKDF